MGVHNKTQSVKKQYQGWLIKFINFRHLDDIKNFLRSFTDVDFLQSSLICFS